MGSVPNLASWQFGGWSGWEVMWLWLHVHGVKNTLWAQPSLEERQSLKKVSVEGSLLNNSRGISPAFGALMIPMTSPPSSAGSSPPVWITKNVIADPGPHYNKTPEWGEKSFSPISNCVSYKTCVWLPFSYIKGLTVMKRHLSFFIVDFFPTLEEKDFLVLLLARGWPASLMTGQASPDSKC